MKLLRMFLIVFAVCLLCGGFGAGVGGLVGYALPSSVVFHYGKDRAEHGTDAALQEQGQMTTATAGVGRAGEDSSSASRGAAFGAAIGLVIGLVLGGALALMDVFIVQIVEWMAKRKQAAPI